MLSRSEVIISNYKADGAVGGGIAFAIVGDHENRPTDMTNLVVLMSEPIILESTQNHATVTDNGICPTLTASMGTGGGYVPMIVEIHEREEDTDRKEIL